MSIFTKQGCWPCAQPLLSWRT